MQVGFGATYRWDKVVYVELDCKCGFPDTFFSQ